MGKIRVMLFGGDTMFESVAQQLKPGAELVFGGDPDPAAILAKLATGAIDLIAIRCDEVIQDVINAAKDAGILICRCPADHIQAVADIRHCIANVDSIY